MEAKRKRSMPDGFVLRSTCPFGARDVCRTHCVRGYSVGMPLRFVEPGKDVFLRCVAIQVPGLVRSESELGRHEQSFSAIFNAVALYF